MSNENKVHNIYPRKLAYFTPCDCSLGIVAIAGSRVSVAPSSPRQFKFSGAIVAVVGDSAPSLHTTPGETVRTEISRLVIEKENLGKALKVLILRCI